MSEATFTVERSFSGRIPLEYLQLAAAARGKLTREPFRQYRRYALLLTEVKGYTFELPSRVLDVVQVSSMLLFTFQPIEIYTPPKDVLGLNTCPDLLTSVPIDRERDTFSPSELGLV